jgi:hypothetical protein
MRTIFVAIVALFGLASCSTSSDSGSIAAPSLLATAGASSRVTTGNAPNFRAAGATHTEYTGNASTANPCNGEFLFVQGPQKNVYVANDDGSHFVIHLALHATGNGNQGNQYIASFEANGQFDAPTGTGGPGVTFFDMPIHAEVISRGAASNFDWDLQIRVFVVNGQVVGSSFFGAGTKTCHG